MSDWSHGYNVSLGYTYGFYREMAPDWMDMCARAAGYVAPRRGANGSFRYLELGSGQGVGLCLLAAANPDGEFVGIDFNPEHIAHSNELASAGGLTNIRFIEGDFAALGAAWPADLGQFDYLAMHGITSWIPSQVLEALIDCLDAAAKPGALVYNSYNTMPGWASTQPFQHIARRMQVVGALAGPKALDDAIGLFDHLIENKSPLLNAFPTLAKRLESIRTQNRAYLIQEYLHENWSPHWFSQMMNKMARAKLKFVGSATIAEQMLPALLPAKLRGPIEGQADPVFRQEIIDLTINQTFRRDIMCRGPRRAVNAQLDGVAKTVVQLLAPPKEETVKISTSFGELSMKPEVSSRIVDALREKPMPIGELLALPTAAGKQAISIQNIMLLAHQSVLGPARAEPADPAAAHRFNAAVVAAASQGAPYSQLAAPITGSAVSLGDADMLLLSAWLANQGADVSSLGGQFTQKLARLGRSISNEGKPLAGDALTQRAQTLATKFLETTLPMLKRSGAVAG